MADLSHTPMRFRHLANVAGALTLLRLAIAATIPFFVHAGWGLPVYVLAQVTDVLDGPIARRTGTSSRFGAVLDGWVDKTLHVNLAWTLVLCDKMPAWWMLLWFSRELIQAPFVPMMTRRFRLGLGVDPESTVIGRSTTILLAIAVGALLAGYDPSPLTFVVGALGAIAGAQYISRHLEDPACS